MSDRALLSDLCTICYAEKPKYRCPRCQTQTCSLPCYKKHQSRASCNGKRDPTRYLKKNQLATPAGIDHDYNYLKSVERRIETADSNCAMPNPDFHQDRQQQQHQTGNSKESALASASRTAARARNPVGALQKYLRDNQIDVEYAPVGMSRQRNNLTRSSNRGKILWTVEWVDLERYVGGKQGELEPEVEHGYWAESSIAAAFEHSCAERRNAEKKRRQDALSSAQTTLTAAGAGGSATSSEHQSPVTNKRKRGSDDEAGQPPPSVVEGQLEQKQGNNQEDGEQSSEANAFGSIGPDDTETLKASGLPVNDTSITSPQTKDVGNLPMNERSQRSKRNERYFYLFAHPSESHTAAAKSKGLLISLGTGSCTFTQALHGQSFREFPTILVTTSSEPPPDYAIVERSPEGLVEADAKMIGKPSRTTHRATDDNRENGAFAESHRLNSSTGIESNPSRQNKAVFAGTSAEDESAEAGTSEQVDPQAILEMLRRDLWN